MYIILISHGKFRLFFPRLPGEDIKIFASIIEKEKNHKKQKQYIQTYRGLKLSKWFSLGVVFYLFVVILLTQ